MIPSELSRRLVLPVQRQLDPFVHHVAAIDIRRSQAVDGQDGRIHKPVFGGALVPVENNSQARIEKAGVDTEVNLFGRFPAYVRVLQDVGVGAGRGRLFVGTEIIYVRRTEGKGREILESADVAVPVLPPAGAQLQEVQQACGSFQKTFIGQYPSGRYGGEVTPTFSRRKVGRTIGA